MNTNQFWPLDFDPEGEIYENLAWDLPGYKVRRKKQSGRGKGTATIAALAGRITRERTRKR